MKTEEIVKKISNKFSNILIAYKQIMMSLSFQKDDIETNIFEQQIPMS